ncbi:Helix-turn-helix domain-containing protein [Candidatus Pantoea varia]|uniref:Helix-turn-helix domain-containing protein n=1 Tax=Candidatus Pantoea varia TaxID=1881036 RepID=A0A1I4X8B6_9GAMM|nr:XRE family transcriptional regulator [Pantoea varia]SFN21686.1 Helix-turn-helix domain-containing protein [Pantoea varia]
MGRTLEQLVADEKPEVVADAQAMARALGITQPTVAGMEKPGRDLKLSTLKRYVDAAGGKLRLVVELPDGSHYGFVV